MVWIATKSYDGQLTVSVAGGAAGGTNATAGSAGTAVIYKINTDGTLTQKLFTDTW